ncbi:MAG TPA: VOC family protein [Fimbriimonadaceae bacterium]|nr:VOC family protein [Fimbriimonadaceae bacterium]
MWRTGLATAWHGESRGKEAAAGFYSRVLGFKRVKEGDGWVEMETGGIRLFLSEDDVKVPAFDLEVPDVEDALRELEQAGFERVVLTPGEKDTFVRDPYGYIYCLSPCRD